MWKPAQALNAIIIVSFSFIEISRSFILIVHESIFLAESVCVHLLSTVLYSDCRMIENQRLDWVDNGPCCEPQFWEPCILVIGIRAIHLGKSIKLILHLKPVNLLDLTCL